LKLLADTIYVEVVDEYGFPYVRIIHIHNPEVKNLNLFLSTLIINKLRKATAFFYILEWRK
jgi:hypothetical protein